MCTPVVCFDIGVARDIVIDGKPGFKVNLYDGKAIRKLKNYDKGKMRLIRNNCILLAINKFSRTVSTEMISKIIK